MPKISMCIDAYTPVPCAITGLEANKLQKLMPGQNADGTKNRKACIALEWSCPHVMVTSLS